MTEERSDPNYEMCQRRAAVEAGRRAYRDDGAPSWARAGRLTAAEAAARKCAEMPGADAGTLTVGTVHAKCPPPVADPSANLRNARLAAGFAVVLVLLWLWIRQRRK